MILVIDRMILVIDRVILVIDRVKMCGGDCVLWGTGEGDLSGGFNWGNGCISFDAEHFSCLFVNWEHNQ